MQAAERATHTTATLRNVQWANQACLAPPARADALNFRWQPFAFAKCLLDSAGPTCIACVKSVQHALDSHLMSSLHELERRVEQMRMQARKLAGVAEASRPRRCTQAHEPAWVRNAMHRARSARHAGAESLGAAFWALCLPWPWCRAEVGCKSTAAGNASCSACHSPLSMPYRQHTRCCRMLARLYAPAAAYRAGGHRACPRHRPQHPSVC